MSCVSLSILEKFIQWESWAALIMVLRCPWSWSRVLVDRWRWLEWCWHNWSNWSSALMLVTASHCLAATHHHQQFWGAKYKELMRFNSDLLRTGLCKMYSQKKRGQKLIKSMLFWCLEKSLCVSSVISESIIAYLQVQGWYCLLSRQPSHCSPSSLSQLSSSLETFYHWGGVWWCQW